MRFLSTLTLFLCVVTSAFAEGKVTGNVADETGQPLPFANIIAYQGEALVKGSVTDETGYFEITNLKDGDFTITIQMMGYETANRTVKISSAKRNVNIGKIVLAEESHQVGEVSVVAQKSTMKLDIDRKVFNVDQDIASAGGSASDVLENIPSVEVDSEGNISLRGSQSVTIWVNDKAQGMTSDNRGDILEQLPSESIDHIEVITNPSSKYSAEGSAGIINIVLKRDRKAGYYGGVQLSVNSKGGGRAGGNINFSSPKFDAYLNLGYGRRVHDNGGWTDRDFMDGNTPTGYLNQTSDGDRKGNNGFFRAGFTWHITDKDEVSFGYMGALGGGDGTTKYKYNSAPYEGFTQPRAFYRERVNESDNDMTLHNFELSYRHEWSIGHFIEATASKSSWNMDGDTYYDQNTYYLDLLTNGVTTGPEAEAIAVNAYQRQKTNLKTRNSWARADYELPIGENAKFQTGYEGNFSRENSPTETFADEAMTQSIRSLFNRFKYDMDVHAAYFNFNHRPAGKAFGYQVGLRGEWWSVESQSYDYEQEYEGKPTDTFSRDYSDIFPTVFLSYKISETQEIQINYTRRLQRPWGGQLNSFKNISDSTNISYGNPELTPEFTNSLELNYLKTWDNHTVSFSAYYRPTSDVIQQISYMDNGVNYSTGRNIAKSQRSGLEIIGKNKLFSRLDLTTTINVFYYTLDGGTFRIKTDQGGEANIVIDDDSDFSWNIREMASVILPKEFTYQATFNFESPTVISQGTRKASYLLDMGIRKQLLNRKLNVALNCRDILDSRSWHTKTSGEGFRQESYSWRGGRRFIVQVGWSFGNMSGRSKRQNSAQNGQSVNGGYGDGGAGED
ncbi:MAG: TonB-dependent receptor [Bacteroidales bacterium]|nr:TonB-dependent receptor [Bacteroidales bacterium]